MPRYLLLLVLLNTVVSVQGQFTEEWSHNRELTTPYFDAEMELISGKLYTHNKIFYDSEQQAQRISTEGVEDWFHSHNQYGACMGCLDGFVVDVAFDASGAAFVAGQQWAIPFSGTYRSKITSGGALEYNMTELNLGGSSQFSEIEAGSSGDELYMTGSVYSTEAMTIVTQLYKMDPEGNIIANELMPPGVQSTIFSLGESDHIYTTGGVFDSLFVASYNAELEYEWHLTLQVAGYYIAGHTVDHYENGDALMIAVLDGMGSINPYLSVARISPDGELAWNTLYELSGDLAHTFKFLDHQVGPDEEAVIYLQDMLGESPVNPRVIRVMATGEMDWDTPFVGVSGLEGIMGYDLFIDESGDVVISADDGQVENGAQYALVSADGEMMSTHMIDDFSLDSPMEMLYAGSNTFYTNLQGTQPAGDVIDQWITKKFSYQMPVSIPELHEEGMTIFPQPADGAISIKRATETSYALYDRTGAQIQYGAMQYGMITIEHIPNGVYYLSSGGICERVVVLHR